MDLRDVIARCGHGVMQVHGAPEHSACQTRHLGAKKKFCWVQVLLDSSFAGFNFCWIQDLLDSSFAGFNFCWIQVLLDSIFAGFKFCWIQLLLDSRFAGFNFLLDSTFERMHFDDGHDLDSIAHVFCTLTLLDSSFGSD